MKPTHAIVAAVITGLTLAAVSPPAEAHRRSRSSVHFSMGFWGPGYWGPGYWGPRHWGPGYWSPGYWGPAYPPAVVVVPSEPRVYVERDETLPPSNAPAPASDTAQWWYWCGSARQYYPYVATCSEGWQRVAPQPAGPR